MNMCRVGLLSCTLLLLCNAYRLPNDVVPRQYTLEVLTHLGDDNDGYSFEGNVTIKVEILNDTDKIVLHSKGLDIIDEELRVTELTDNSTSSEDNLYKNMMFMPEDDFLVLKLSGPVTKHRLYNIRIQYKGNLSEGLSGYYRSSYFDKTGTKRWLAVTHFEPSDARRAFPCFDEPEMKAMFQINLGRREKYQSASNMPVKVTESMIGKKGWQWDRYEVSPNMSTYLAAFLVADLRSVTSESQQKRVKYRIWARPEAITQTSYALQVGPKVLDYFEQFFNVSYPLPKMDMAAIPDFGPGAMENWGLVTYRETALLYDPETTSAEQKVRVAYVISHELAHQWFGNLVTMKWWSDLWLNEGFATYVGSLGVHHAHPEWGYLDSASFDHFLITMSLDALKSSHSISVAVGRPEEVEQIFDAISYKKGASLLRMINHFLGEDVFRRGVSSYLHQHQYGNAVQDDLWTSLTTEAQHEGVLAPRMTVKSIMDTWTLQTGYPIVSVIRNYEHATATLAQKRYLLDKSQSNDTGGECWLIPITYSSASNPTFNETKPKLWLNCSQEVTNVSNMPGPDQWVIFNNRLSGLYRVQYDTRNWQLIREALNGADLQKIDPLNKGQLLNDVLALAWTGDVEYNLALDIARYLRRERHYLPWRTALDGFSRLEKILRRTPDYHHYRSYLKSLLMPSLEGMEDISELPEDFQELKQHLQLVKWSCRLQIGGCIQQAVRLFEQWSTTSHPDSENPIARDVRSVVYCSAVKYGSEAEWQFVFDRYLNASVPSEKVVLLNSLGCTREPWLLRRFLHLAHTLDGPIRKQDSRYVFYAVSSNVVGYSIAKEYLITNVVHIHNFYHSNAGKLSGYVTALAQHMFTERDLSEWKQFLEDHEDMLKESKRAVQQSLESVLVNMQWYHDHYQNFVLYLQNHTAA